MPPELPASPLQSHLPRINGADRARHVGEIAPRLVALAGDEDPGWREPARASPKGSPTSAVLSFELQRRTCHPRWPRCSGSNTRPRSAACPHDFAEGCALGRQGQKPVWQPATLDQVSPGLIEAHPAAFRRAASAGRPRLSPISDHNRRQA